MPDDRDLTERASAATPPGLSARTRFAGFWSWWTGELATFVPRTARTAVKRRRLRPVLAFEADHAALWRPVSGAQGIAMEAAVKIPLAGDAAAGRAALDSVPRVVYGGASAPARVVVALPARSVLRRSLSLPAAVEEGLVEALAFDLDRHTPFKADELYFDAAVVGREPAHGRIRVDLAAARRSVVDRAVAQAESWGATVVGVTPDAPASTEPSRLNLLPAERRPAPGAGAWLRIWAPLALLVALVAVAVALPVWQKREYAIALLRIVDEARAQAAVSEGLRATLEKETADYNFPLERKFAFPSSLQVLDEITKLLPDDTWLTQMEVKTQARGKEAQRELLMRGESGNAGRLITLFEESKVFTQAAPRSPTTKIQPGPGEIFDLAAQLRPLAKPAPVDLAAVAVSGAPARAGGAATGSPPPGTPAAPPAPANAAGPSAAAATPAAPPPSPAVPPAGPAGTPAAASAPGATPPSSPAAPTANPGGASGAAAPARAPGGPGGGRAAGLEPGCVAAVAPVVAPVVGEAAQGAAVTPALVAKLSPAQSRALALALLLALVAAVAAVLLVPALLLHRHYDEAIASANDRLARYKRVAAQAPDLQRALDAVRVKNGRRFYLRNTAVNLASAELSELAKTAIESAGGRITTSQNIPPKDDERFKQLGVNVQFFATTANLQKILAALESQEPLVSIHSLTVRPVNAFRGFKPPPGQEPEVIVQIEAFAWLFADNGRPAADAPAAAAAPKG